jgi:hypothetical protein
VKASVKSLRMWGHAHLNTLFLGGDNFVAAYLYTRLSQTDSAVEYLICARDYGGTMFDADRVVFAHVRVTTACYRTVKQTPLLTRTRADTSESWKNRLGEALQSIGLNPVTMHSLKESVENIELKRKKED